VPSPSAEDAVILASVADPDFGSANEAGASGTREILSRGESLPRLPGSEMESKRVVQAFEKSLGRGTAVSLRGKNAGEKEVRGIVPGKRFLHVATHGLVDERSRHLFAALALTPPQEVTSSEDDGLLQLYEIYGLDLAGCRLAVLSACRTNRGRQVQGEGIFGLSRGFLAAGAGRVAATQWSISDESTALLVGGFFERIAAAESDQTPVDYATALRDAKRDVRNTAKWPSPFHWAPMILIGAR